MESTDGHWPHNYEKLRPEVADGHVGEVHTSIPAALDQGAPGTQAPRDIASCSPQSACGLSVSSDDGVSPASTGSLGPFLRYASAEEGPSHRTVVPAPVTHSPTVRPNSGRHTRPNEAQTRILLEFYHTRHKNPSYEERVLLANDTGLHTEGIKQWFRAQRAVDSSYDPPKEVRNPRKKTVRLNEDQRVFLECYLIVRGTPDEAQRAEIARQIDVDSEFVYNWFNDHEFKRRRHSGSKAASVSYDHIIDF